MHSDILQRIAVVEVGGDQRRQGEQRDALEMVAVGEVQMLKHSVIGEVQVREGGDALRDDHLKREVYGSHTSAASKQQSE